MIPLKGHRSSAPLRPLFNFHFTRGVARSNLWIQLDLLDLHDPLALLESLLGPAAEMAFPAANESALSKVIGSF